MKRIKHLALLTGLCISAVIPLSSLNAAVIFFDDFDPPTHPVADNTDPQPVPTNWDVTRSKTFEQGLWDEGLNGDQAWYAQGNSGWSLTTTAANLSAPVVIGNEYTLSFLYWANNRLGDRGTGFIAELLAINDDTEAVTVLGSDIVSLSSGNSPQQKADALTFTLSVTPTTNAGERLAIRLLPPGSGGPHTMIDDVMLVPEPTTALLGGLGLLALLRRRRPSFS